MGRKSTPAYEKQKNGRKSEEEEEKPDVPFQSEETEDGDQTHHEVSMLNGEEREEEEEEEEEKPAAEEGKGQESEDEIWDIVRVIPTAEEQIPCRIKECSKNAVVSWASNLHPEDNWDVCVGCQVDEFGGWPKGVVPIKTSADSNGSDNEKSESLDISKTSSGSTKKNDTNNEGTKSDDGDTMNPIVQCNTPEAVESTEEEAADDDGEEDESYDLRKIVTLEELINGPPLCKGGDKGGCTLPACSVWISKKNPGEKWYYCIDCQQRDFGGWPPVVEMPCKHLEPDHLEMLAKKCSQRKNPSMPILTHCITPPPKSLVRDKKKKVTVAKVASASQLASHAKFLGEAKKYGGNRIIVDKKEAKQVVLDTLSDAFRPMNFNELYKTLKAEVPRASLDVVLKDMAIGTIDDNEEVSFSGSDDDDDDGDNSDANTNGVDKKKLGPLIFKHGKNTKSNIYYVDYTQKSERTAEERQSLSAKTASTNSDLERLKNTLKVTNDQTKKLQSEPTNDQLNSLLNDMEKEVSELVENVDQAQSLIVNEPHKNALKRKQQKWLGDYGKLKGVCMDGLSNMEEMSDGAISSKKILSGGGQFDIDTDEAVNESAKAAKTNVVRFPRKKKGKNTETLADPNFVGVELDGYGYLKRVYVE